MEPADNGNRAPTYQNAECSRDAICSPVPHPPAQSPAAAEEQAGDSAVQFVRRFANGVCRYVASDGIDVSESHPNGPIGWNREQKDLAPVCQFISINSRRQYLGK